MCREGLVCVCGREKGDPSGHEGEMRVIVGDSKQEMNGLFSDK